MTLPPDPAWEKTRENGSGRLRKFPALVGSTTYSGQKKVWGWGWLRKNSLQKPELRSLQPHSPGPQMQPLSQSCHLAFIVVLTDGLLGDFEWGSCQLHSSFPKGGPGDVLGLGGGVTRIGGWTTGSLLS